MAVVAMSPMLMRRIVRSNGVVGRQDRADRMPLRLQVLPTHHPTRRPHLALGFGPARGD